GWSRSSGRPSAASRALVAASSRRGSSQKALTFTAKTTSNGAAARDAPAASLTSAHSSSSLPASTSPRSRSRAASMAVFERSTPASLASGSAAASDSSATPRPQPTSRTLRGPSLATSPTAHAMREGTLGTNADSSRRPAAAAPRGSSWAASGSRQGVHTWRCPAGRLTLRSRAGPRLPWYEASPGPPSRKVPPEVGFSRARPTLGRGWEGRWQEGEGGRRGATRQAADGRRTPRVLDGRRGRRRPDGGLRRDRLPPAPAVAPLLRPHDRLLAGLRGRRLPPRHHDLARRRGHAAVGAAAGAGDSGRRGELLVGPAPRRRRVPALRRGRRPQGARAAPGPHGCRPVVALRPRLAPRRRAAAGRRPRREAPYRRGRHRPHAQDLEGAGGSQARTLRRRGRARTSARARHSPT